MKPVSAPAMPSLAPGLRAIPSQDDVATQFEALLLRDMVKAMRESAMGGEETGGQLVDHLIEDALATHLARSGGIGLKRFITETEEPVVVPSTDMQLRLARWVRGDSDAPAPVEPPGSEENRGPGSE